MKTSLAKYPSRLAVAVRAAYAGSGLLRTDRKLDFSASNIMRLPSPLPTLVLALVATLATAPFARSQAVITWGTPTVVSSPADVVTTGTYHASIYAWSDTVALVIGGVSFNDSSPLIAFTSTTQNLGRGGNIGTDVDYRNMISSGYEGPYLAPFSILLSGLILGDTYRVQLWTPTWDSDQPTTFTAGNSVDMNNTATQPTYAVGSFVATSTTQTITVSSTPLDGTAILSAVSVFNITAIPEPSTYAALAGLGAFGLAFWRRRSRRAADGGTGRIVRAKVGRAAPSQVQNRASVTS